MGTAVRAYARAAARGHAGELRLPRVHPTTSSGRQHLTECARRPMAFDLVIDIENSPGALAGVAGAISDAGVNISAATCFGAGERVELHILVPHAEAAKHALAISRIVVSREREVVAVEVEDNPGVL